MEDAHRSQKNHNHEHDDKYATKQVDNNDKSSTLIMTNFTPTSKVSNKTLQEIQEIYSIIKFSDDKKKVLLVVEFIVFCSSQESPGF